MNYCHLNHLSKMLGRHRKLTFGTLWNEESSEGCVQLGSTAVYRRLMDPPSGSSGPAVPHYAQLGSNHGGDRDYTSIHKRFEKSVSEDSGVEIPPPSPFGSESSYNPDEPESLESSTPEYSESPESFTPEDPGSVKSSCYENQDSFGHSEEPHRLELIASKNSGSLQMPIPQRDTDIQEYFLPPLRERDTSGVPHKLEQAVLRSRRLRCNSRESIQNRAARCNRQYPGSLKDHRRGKTFTLQARSPTRLSEEIKQEQDPLPLPGDGLRYLESLCDMLEQIAGLQQKNLDLQREKREAEERLRHRVVILDSCVCGSSQAVRDSHNDQTDNAIPNGRAWEPQHYRKRSTSHAGMLLNLARQSDSTLKDTNKMEPHYVSVPNLQGGDRQRTNQNKAETSQWHKLKDILSKLARKSAGPIAAQGTTHSAEPHYSCRTQKLLEGTAQQPRRLFLPGLVIRPRGHNRQFQ